MVTRLQTDGKYKITTLLIYLFQTIESETISNHMHCAGSHQIQIPTYLSKNPTRYISIDNVQQIINYLSQPDRHRTEETNYSIDKLNTTTSN